MSTARRRTSVSRTSSSCLIFFEPQPVHSGGSSRETISVPHSSQYHTGILCPHHSCLERHQSLMFSIQLRYTFFHLSG